MDSQERLNKILDARPELRGKLTTYEMAFKDVKQAAIEAKENISTLDLFLYYWCMCSKYDRKQANTAPILYGKFTKQEAEETEKELGVEGLSQYFGN